MCIAALPLMLTVKFTTSLESEGSGNSYLALSKPTIMAKRRQNMNLESKELL